MCSVTPSGRLDESTISAGSAVVGAGSVSQWAKSVAAGSCWARSCSNTADESVRGRPVEAMKAANGRLSRRNPHRAVEAMVPVSSATTVRWV